MAIVRIPKTIKKFEYEGVTFGLRPALVKEQMKISAYLAEYARSIKRDAKVDIADGTFEKMPQTGDMAIMIECQQYVCETLVVDPETKAQVFGTGPDQESINELTADFLKQAWFCYSGQTTTQYKAINLVDVFGKEFVEKNAIIESEIVDAEISRLDGTDSAAAHKARVALDLVKPGSEVSQGNPPTPATTTLFSEGPSSPSPSSSTSPQEKSTSGSGEPS